ncbi:MAG: protoporphyrinogen oxidase [Nitrospirae bacterium]|nr:protoporphyrinogen oxidase [Nitrospirota bacterium]
MAVPSRHVAIVGGGIAGLATAFALQERAAETGLPLPCTLIEADSRWGGKILTHRIGEFLIEAGPDSFLSQKPWGLALCAKLGLTDRLINTNEDQKKTFVFSRGRLRELPEGLIVIVPTELGPFLRSGLLSGAGIARMAMDFVLPAKRKPGDESLAAFFRRRLGREAFERVIEPLMAGIYAGDAEQISLRATFPRFLEMEQEYGSLIRGMLAGRKRATPTQREGEPGRSMFVTLKDGLDEMVRALVTRVKEAGVTLMSERRVEALRVRSGRPGVWTYDLLLEHGPVVTADAVVLATPAYASADLVRPLSPGAAGLLESIPYASTATVSLAYSASELGSSVCGFGFVVPRVERRDLLAATWTSLKWPHRAPTSHVLVRCYVGGIGREEILKTDDETLVRRVREDLAGMAGVTAQPAYVEVNRWHRSMPQYTLGHLERLEDIQASLGRYKGLWLTGAAYRGIGIPDCIREATETATQVVRYLSASPL